MTTTTQWDDDRLRAVVVPWSPRRGSQVALGQSDGLTVRVFDHGPADGRSVKGTLILDSEVRHQGAGIFGDHADAQAYADRAVAALLEERRQWERVKSERDLALAAAQHERYQALEEAKSEASAANKRARDMLEEIKTLHEEAMDPSLTVDIPLRGEGYRVILEPSLTDGNKDDAEGQTLVDTIVEAAPKTKSRRRSGKKAPKRKAGRKPALAVVSSEPAATEVVPDCEGQPLKKGSRVMVPGLEITEARVLQILPKGPDGYRIQIEDTTGKPIELPADECSKLLDDEEPGVDNWPE